MKFIERPDCMPLTRGNKVIEVAPEFLAYRLASSIDVKQVVEIDVNSDKMEVAQVVEPVAESPKLDAPKKRSKKE